MAPNKPESSLDFHLSKEIMRFQFYEPPLAPSSRLPVVFLLYTLQVPLMFSPELGAAGDELAFCGRRKGNGFSYL